MPYVLRKIQDVLPKESQWPEQGLPTLADFKDNRVIIDQDSLSQATLRFEQSGQLVLFGPPDYGKTFLAWSLGYHYYQDRTVWYGKASELEYEDAIRFMRDFRSDLFIIEDCHLKQKEITDSLGDLKDSGVSPMLILTARAYIPPDDPIQDDRYLDLTKSCGLKVKPSKEHIREVVSNYIQYVNERYGPSDYTEVTQEELEKAAIKNGSNLRYLMIRLRTWDHRNEHILGVFERDEPMLEFVYQRYLRHVKKRIIALPLSAINRFEVPVAKRFLEEKGDISPLLSEGLAVVETYPDNCPGGEYLSLPEPKEGSDILRAAKWKQVLRAGTTADMYMREVLLEYARSAPANYLELLRGLGQVMELRRAIIHDPDAFNALKVVGGIEPVARFSILMSIGNKVRPEQSTLLWNHYTDIHKEDMQKILSKAGPHEIQSILRNAPTESEQDALIDSLDMRVVARTLSAVSFTRFVHLLTNLLRHGPEKAKQLLQTPEFEPRALAETTREVAVESICTFIGAARRVPGYDVAAFLWATGPEELAVRSENSGLAVIVGAPRNARKVDDIWANQFLRSLDVAKLAAKAGNSGAAVLLKALRQLAYIGEDVRFLEKIASSDLSRIASLSSISSLAVLFFHINRKPSARSWARNFASSLASLDLTAKLEGSTVEQTRKLLWNVLQASPDAAERLCRQIAGANISRILCSESLHLKSVNGLIGNMEQCNRHAAEELFRKLVQPDSVERESLGQILERSEARDIRWLIWRALLIDPHVLSSELVGTLDTQVWVRLVESATVQDAFWLTWDIYQSDENLARRVAMDKGVVQQLSSPVDRASESMCNYFARLGLLHTCGVDLEGVQFSGISLKEIVTELDGETDASVAVLALEAFMQKLPASQLSIVRHSVDLERVADMFETSSLPGKTKLLFREIHSRFASIP